MEFGLNKDDVVNICKVFENIDELEEAIVFGSRAKGNYKSGSDVDLALKGRDLNLKVLNRISNELDDLYLPYIFDLCNYSLIENPDLKDHIKRIGIPLYRNYKKGLTEEVL